MTPLEWVLCIFFIFFSGYLSASETALFSLSRFQIRSLKENFQSTHQKIKKLLLDPSGLLITLLVCNDVVNIALTSLITKKISQYPFSFHTKIAFLQALFPRWGIETGISILITAPILLFLCEITPKSIASHSNRLVATLAVGPLTLIYQLFKPIRIILKQLINFFIKLDSKIIPKKATKKKWIPGLEKETILSESDFLFLLEEACKEGSIQKKELHLIRNVFELDTTLVSEIATPLSQVLTFSIHTTIKSALETLKNKHYSRIPVLSENRKEIAGIIYSKDLLYIKNKIEHLSEVVANQMRKPFFVSSNLKINTLFRKFKEYKVHMAIVKTPEGVPIGVITMSDILDMLFENFFPHENILPLHSKTKTRYP